MARKSLIEYNLSFESPITLFSILGFKIFEERQPIKRIIYFWFQFSFQVYCIFGALVYAPQYLQKSFLMMVELMAYCAIAVMGLLKLYIIYLKRDVIRQIKKDLFEIFPRTLKNQQKYEVCLKSEILQTNLIMKHYSTLFMILILMFNSLPLVESFIYFYQTSIWIGNFPFHIWSYFNDKSSYVTFAITYIVQDWSGFNTVCSTTAVDILLCVYISHICLQFEMVNQDFSKLTFVNHKEDADVMIQNVQRHQKIIIIASELEEVYSLIVLLNFIGSTFLICVTGFMAVSGINLYRLLKFSAFLFSSLIQTFVLCWYGNRMIISVSIAKIILTIIIIFIFFSRAPTCYNQFIIQTGVMHHFT